MKTPILFLSVLMLLGVIFFTPQASFAGLGVPFGGRIVKTIPCACSGNLLLYIADPRGTVWALSYQPGLTRLYAYYKPFPPVNTIGTFAPGGVCLIPATPCTVIPSMGTITMMGTSRF